MCQMAQIFVQHTHHNPKSTDLRGWIFWWSMMRRRQRYQFRTCTADRFNRDKTPTVSRSAVWLEPCWQRYSRLKG
jgi:hypothetical protein